MYIMLKLRHLDATMQYFKTVRVLAPPCSYQNYYTNIMVGGYVYDSISVANGHFR